MNKDIVTENFPRFVSHSAEVWTKHLLYFTLLSQVFLLQFYVMNMQAQTRHCGDNVTHKKQHTKTTYKNKKTIVLSSLYRIIHKHEKQHEIFISDTQSYITELNILISDYKIILLFSGTFQTSYIFKYFTPFCFKQT